jgi:hypothetical protein
VDAFGVTIGRDAPAPSQSRADTALLDEFDAAFASPTIGGEPNGGEGMAGRAGEILPAAGDTNTGGTEIT